MKPFVVKTFRNFSVYLNTVQLQLVLLCCLLSALSIHSFAEDGSLDKKPKIKGQRSVTINFDQSYTIELTDLEVDDASWWYPFGFTLRAYDGNNYSHNGNTITPSAGFEGDLYVPVTVNDGEEDSEEFDFKITVIGPNDPPVITAQQSIDTNEEHSFTLRRDHLVIEDP